MAAYTEIDDSSAFFQTTIYTGNGSSSRAITNGGNSNLQPDFTWIKGRSGGGDDSTEHALTDSVRGVTKELSTNDIGLEETVAQGLTAFGSNGFTVGTDASYNTNSDLYVSWNWKASGSTSTNSDGDINGTQTVSQTAGFSVTTYSGNGGSNQRLGHGLGVTPQVYIIKRRDNSGQWLFVNTLIDGTLDYMFLETTGAKSNSGRTLPTSSVVYLENGGDANESGGTHVMYAFAEKQGYSKFSSYVGNGNADGAFVYTGFKPAFILVKRSNSSGTFWYIFDNKRDGKNTGSGASGGNRSVGVNTIYKEEVMSGYPMDILSNGFKWYGSSNQQNGSGDTYVFMAFAEQPFVTSTGVPATAR